jgi:DnaJ-class molecular chaperone
MITVLEAIRILDLDRKSKPTKADLKKAYRRKSLQTHPDKGGCSADFIQVQIAYELLSDDAILNSFRFGNPHSEATSFAEFATEFDTEHVQSLIIQICKKYASGLNPTVLSNIATSINLVSNLLFDAYPDAPTKSTGVSKWANSSRSETVDESRQTSERTSEHASDANVDDNMTAATTVAADANSDANNADVTVANNAHSRRTRTVSTT